MKNGMTVASEISRLQNAKADIKTAIESKGVTVPSGDTIDCYASCIDSIETGGLDGMLVDVLVVGGGGGGGNGNSCGGGGGGGGGGVIECYNLFIEGKGAGVVVGTGGASGCNGGDSYFGNLRAFGGGAGGGGNCCGCEGGSGGGAGSYFYNSGGLPGGNSIERQGNWGGYSVYISTSCKVGGGGGGAGAKGNDGNYYYMSPEGYNRSRDNNCTGGYGGDGIVSKIPGCRIELAAGGGGGKDNCRPGLGGGGCGFCYDCSIGGNGGNNSNGCPGNCYGGGGGGAGKGSYTGGSGCHGVVYIRYKADGSSGNKCTMCGGIKYSCNGYCIHRFDSDGVFYENDGCKKVKYIVVGGGAGGAGSCCCPYSTGGGGGGEVRTGITNIECNSIPIIVGAGGSGGKSNTYASGGCYSSFGTIKSLGGCRGTCKEAGTSGSGNRGGGCENSATKSMQMQPGGGAFTKGLDGGECRNRGYSVYLKGGFGLYGYGGGGSGMYMTKAVDGGGIGGTYATSSACIGGNASNCGGGGGSGEGYGGNGGNGLVEVCYPADGRWGINSATGGNICCTKTEGGITYCVHRFTSNGTLCITG